MENKILMKNENSKLITEAKIGILIDYYCTMYGTKETIDFLSDLQKEFKKSKKPLLKGVCHLLKLENEE